MNPNVKEDIVCGAVIVGSVLAVACLVAALATAAVELNVFCKPAEAAIEHTTINRAEHMDADSGDSELPVVRLANLIDECLNDLPVPQQIILVRSTGMFLEFVGKGKHHVAQVRTPSRKG